MPGYCDLKYFLFQQEKGEINVMFSLQLSFMLPKNRNQGCLNRTSEAKWGPTECLHLTHSKPLVTCKLTTLLIEHNQSYVLVMSRECSGDLKKITSWFSKNTEVTFCTLEDAW